MTLISSILLFSLLIPSAGLRCYIPGTPSEALGKAKAVFAGKVIGREYVKDDSSEKDIDGERLVIKIAVERVWKGDVGREALMYTSEVRQANDIISMMAEDFHFVDEKSYLIYARGPMTRLQTSICMRSRELEKAADDLKALGEGQEPKEK